MADEPITALTKIAAPTGTPPYPTAFTSPTTGAMLEIIDTTNTSMASTGTNSRIAPGDLIKGFLAAGTGMTITETAGIVTLASSGGFTNPMTTAGDLIDGGSAGAAQRLAIGSTGQVLTVASGAPAWANPVTKTYVTGTLTSNVNLTTSYATIGNGLTVTLPSAGTYVVFANVRVEIGLHGTLGQYIGVNGQLYDTTNAAAIANTQTQMVLNFLQATLSSATYQQQTTLIGPAIYTVAGSTVIDVQGVYGISAILDAALFGTDSNGASTICAIRIA